MVILIVVSVPIAILNELNSIAALFLAKGIDFVSVFERPRSDVVECEPPISLYFPK
jgi:hypothetical protein